GLLEAGAVGVGGSGVEASALDEVTLRGAGAGSDFPLGLGRQAGAAPVGVGVGFVVADVAERLPRVEGLHAGQGEGPPLAVAALPVERRFPSFARDRGPAVGEPELRAPGAA